MKTQMKNFGQSLIEFALLLPVLALMIMGLFDVGRAVFYYSVLNSAVREGTRFAITQSNCDYKSNPGACSGGYLDSYPLNCEDAVSTATVRICSEIRDRLFNITDLSTGTITINQFVSGIGDPLVAIDIDFLFEPITPGLGLISDLTLHARSQMMMTPVGMP